MGRLSTLEERQAEMRESHSTQEPSLLSLMPHGERHYSVNDVAQLWGLSRDSVRRIFRREPGVLVIGDKYVTLRIPDSVLERVHRRLSNADGLNKERSWMSPQRQAVAGGRR
jgi:transcriptional regulator GlxA family with amidase domain